MSPVPMVLPPLDSFSTSRLLFRGIKALFPRNLIEFSPPPIELDNRHSATLFINCPSWRTFWLKSAHRDGYLYIISQYFSLCCSHTAYSQGT